MSTRKNKTTYNPQFFNCPFGYATYIEDLKLSSSQRKILWYIVGQFSAWNYNKKRNVAVVISTAKFKEIAKTKSNSTIQRAIKILKGKGIIDVSVTRGKTSQFKIIDPQLLPYKTTDKYR